MKAKNERTFAELRDRSGSTKLNKYLSKKSAFNDVQK
jgi:hypothetical protein